MMSKIEAMITARIGRNFEEDFDQTQFDVLLLSGVNLGELTIEDKNFLEKFNQVKTLNLSYTGLRSLKNLPVISTVERLDLSDTISMEMT